MLDTEQTDTFCTEGNCSCSILRSVGIGTHAHSPELVHDFHKLHETRILGSVHSVESGCINQTLGTVEGN